MIQNLINNQIEKLCVHNSSLVDAKASTDDIATITDSIISMAKVLHEFQSDELNDPAYSIEKVAQMMDISPQKVRDLCRDGKIVSFRAKEGSLIKIRASKYNEFVLSREAVERETINNRKDVIELEKGRKQRKVNQVS